MYNIYIFVILNYRDEKIECISNTYDVYTYMTLSKCLQRPFFHASHIIKILYYYKYTHCYKWIIFLL